MAAFEIVRSLGVVCTFPGRFLREQRDRYPDLVVIPVRETIALLKSRCSLALLFVGRGRADTACCSPTNACGHFPRQPELAYVCAMKQRDFNRGNCFRVLEMTTKSGYRSRCSRRKRPGKCADHAERPYDFEGCHVRFRRKCVRSASENRSPERPARRCRLVRPAETDHHPVCVRKITD